MTFIISPALVLLALLAAWALAHATGTVMDAGQFRIGLLAWVVPAVGIVAGAVRAVPDRWREPARTVAMLGMFAGTRLFVWEDAGLLVAPALAVVAARWLPLHRERFRKGLTVALTVGMLAWLVIRVPYPRSSAGVVFQFLVLADAVGRGLVPRGWTPCLRAVCAANATTVTPFAPEDVVREDRSARAALTGAGWVLGGVCLMVAHAVAVGHPWLDPWQEAARLAMGPSVAAAAAFWAWVMAWNVGTMLVDSGSLRLMGMPARAPIDAPWRAVDFLDYWRRANTLRYRLLTDVYFRPFLPTRGRWMPAGVFAVFLVSGLHHAITAPWAGFAFARWAIEGMAAASTAAWRDGRSRTRARDWVRGIRPRPTPAWLGAAAAVGVIVAHGFLMAMARPDAATVAVFRHWLPAAVFWS